MPTSGIQFQCLRATNKAGTPKSTQHFIVLQPGDKEMTVSEGILYLGDPKLTYNDPVNGSRPLLYSARSRRRLQRHRESGRRDAHPAPGDEDQRTQHL